MKRPNWFRCCMECQSTEPNQSGICANCEVKHGYSERLVDDIDPASREPKDDTHG